MSLLGSHLARDDARHLQYIFAPDDGSLCTKNATAKQKQRARAQRMAQVMAALHQEEQRVIFQRRLERATYHQIFKSECSNGRVGRS